MQLPTTPVKPVTTDSDPFLDLSRVTGSSRILAITDRLGLGVAIWLAACGFSLCTLLIALTTHYFSDQPIGVIGILNSTVIPLLLSVPTLTVLLTLCRRLEVTRAELARLSSLDMLTGALNRRSILAWGSAACLELNVQNEIAAEPHSLSIALLDADGFKLVNDRHGHLCGDEVLRRLCTTARRTLPSNCHFGRFGGEEFAVIMPNHAHKTALALAESLRAAVQNDCAQIDGKAINLTVSVGVTTSDSADNVLETLLSQADEALYAAKRSGRNKVESWFALNPRPKGSVNVIPL